MSAEPQPDSSITDFKPMNSGGDFARTRRRDRAPATVARDSGGGYLFGNDPAKQLISSEWPRMAVVMVMTLALLTSLNLVIPPLLPTAVALSAAGLAAIAVIGLRIEGQRTLTSGQRMAIVGVVIALPMFLFGAAMGLFVEAGVFEWFECIAAIATVALVATIIQSGRLVGVLAAQVAAWSGLTCAASTLGGFIALVLGFAIAIVAYKRQHAIDLIVREKAEKDQRAQTRAQEILADYEETGQGWFWETDRDRKSVV